MQSRRSFLAVPAAFAFVDWPQWRGPARDGSVPAEVAKPWPERLRQVWNVPVGEGHSSPVVTGKRAFQFTRLQDREVIAAYDLDSGKQIWQHGYPAPYTMNPSATAHGKGPKATPAVAANRVYTLGIEGVLTCWDANTGSKVWNFDSKGSPVFGTASSPVIDGTTLIAAIGPQKGGSLTAFDAASGKMKWQWKEDGPAYASPVIVSCRRRSSSHHELAEQSDRRRAFRWQTTVEAAAQNFLRSEQRHSADRWRSGDLLRPRESCHCHSAGSNATEGLGEQRSRHVHELSRTRRLEFSGACRTETKASSSASIPRPGKTVWTGEGRQAENAALVARGETVFALTTNSELQVFRATPKALQLVRTYHVADTPTWAHPVILGSRVLIKDANSLALWSAE